MKKILKREDYSISSWSGGTTTQLAIGPEGSLYADRTFLWRISSATVDLPESDFTALPDYNRLITPLAGEMFLSHDNGEEFEVPIGTIHAFDGGANTHSRGTCTDFNLMLRKGTCEGTMEAFSLKAGEERTITASLGETVLIYLFRGTTPDLNAGESAVLTDDSFLLIASTDCFGIITTTHM